MAKPVVDRNNPLKLTAKLLTNSKTDTNGTHATIPDFYNRLGFAPLSFRRKSGICTPSA